MKIMEETAAFLHAEGWIVAKTFPLKADFSTRQFMRLELAGGDPRRAILMKADKDQKTPQFVALSEALRRCGLSAPAVYAARPDQGLVLMEDFGDVTLGRLLDEGKDAAFLYRRAADVLVHLHKAFKSAFVERMNLPVFNAALFTEQTALFLDYYFPHVRARAPSNEERAAFHNIWMVVLKPLEALPQTLMLRDFTPDNLMDLPGRQGVASVGVIDFQDGGLGPLPYDISSLCEKVRRDSALALLDEISLYYHREHPVMPLEDLRRACRILAAQRHTRILGIIVRLAENRAQNGKLAHKPRIRKYLEELLQDEALSPVKAWFDRYVSPYERM